jgi:hypothetical protein
MPVSVHRQLSAALTQLGKQKDGLRKRRVRTDVHVFEAKTRLNQACRGNKLRFMYTLTTRDPITDLFAFDREIHRLTERLTEEGIKPRAVSRERTEAGNWHAHLAVSRLVDLKLLIRLWALGYVKPPEFTPEGLVVVRDKQGRIKRRVIPSWKRVAHYLGKSFSQLPPGVRFAFYSKLDGSKAESKSQVPETSVLEAFFAQVKDVRLNRLSRFHLSAERLVFELHEEPAPKGENTTAMAELGRFALHIARQQRRERVRVAGAREKTL